MKLKLPEYFLLTEYEIPNILKLREGQFHGNQGNKEAGRAEPGRVFRKVRHPPPDTPQLGVPQGKLGPPGMPGICQGAASKGR